MKPLSGSYGYVGHIGSDMQFALWGIAGLIIVFTFYRLSAMSDRLFPNRPSMWRTWRTSLILVTIILMLSGPAGAYSRGEHLYLNISKKYQNVSVSKEEITAIIDVYNRGRGDMLVVGGTSNPYHLVANGKDEPTIVVPPGSSAEAPVERSDKPENKEKR